MPGIPFIKDFKFDYGTAMEVTPLIRRVVAHNPSPFTFKGTGTYIIGHGKVAVVDPRPDMQDHIDAVLRAVRGETLGEHGYSKDYRPDLRQMILALIVDGAGRPICTVMKAASDVQSSEPLRP